MASLVNKVFWTEFIRIYRDHEELWKISNEKHKSKTSRNKGYVMLLKKFREVEPDATINSVKKKINNLRSSYKRELRKVQRSEKAGYPENESYKPMLWYFDELNFLKDEEVTNETGTVFEIQKEKTEIKSEYQNRTNNICNNRPIISRTENVDQPKELFYERAIDPIENTNDAAEIYGRAWAFEYRKLTTDQRLYAKKYIDDILFQGRLENLTEKWSDMEEPQYFSSTQIDYIHDT